MNGQANLQLVTHIISKTSDFEDYFRACELMIPVVKPDWITTSIEKKKIAQIRQYSPDPNLFFSNVVVCCVDLPSGDKEAIIGGVIALGGKYSNNLTRQVNNV